MKTVSVPFGDVDPLSLDAVQMYEDALTRAQSVGTKIRALVLCTPHNPLGKLVYMVALVRGAEYLQVAATPVKSLSR